MFVRERKAGAGKKLDDRSLYKIQVSQGRSLPWVQGNEREEEEFIELLCFFLITSTVLSEEISNHFSPN